MFETSENNLPSTVNKLNATGTAEHGEDARLAWSNFTNPSGQKEDKNIHMFCNNGHFKATFMTIEPRCIFRTSPSF